MKTAHIIFFTASGLWPWDVLPTPFKATLAQHSDDFCLSFDSKTHDSNLNANVFVLLDESQRFKTSGKDSGCTLAAEWQRRILRERRQC